MLHERYSLGDPQRFLQSRPISINFNLASDIRLSAEDPMPPQRLVAPANASLAGLALREFTCGSIPAFLAAGVWRVSRRAVKYFLLHTSYHRPAQIANKGMAKGQNCGWKGQGKTGFIIFRAECINKTG
jgi:hypothetical protein